MKNKRKPFKLGTAGVVIALLVAGLATTFSVRALMAQGFFAPFADAASIAAAKKKAVKKKAPAKKKVTKPAAKKPAAKPAAAPAAAPAPSAPPTVSVHDADFVLKCGINGDKTLKPGDNPDYRDLLRYNCIQDDIIEIWKKEFREAKAYPDAEIQKRTGAKPKVLETNKNNGSVKYQYNFSGNTIIQWQGDRFDGDSKCWYIDMWDYRKGGGAGGKQWSIEGGQGGSLDCEDTTPAPSASAPASTPDPAPTSSVGPATSDHTVDVTLKCGTKDIVLQFVDRPAPEVQLDQWNPDYGKVKDAPSQLNDKRIDCVQSILDAWHDDVVFAKGKAYPDKIMQQRLGVAPVEYKDSWYSDGRKMWKYYFSGDSILKSFGDKFAPADENTGMKGSPCYKYTITDGRAMPKISADAAMVGKWTSTWRENGTVVLDPTCSKPDKNK